MSEFDGITNDQLRNDIQDFLRPAQTATTTDAKVLADAQLRVDWIMKQPAGSLSPSDVDFLRTQALETLRGM